jgi:predicted nucleic acid-binding protein
MPDTSCIVAAVCSWHEHHGRAAGAIEERLSRKRPMLIAAHSLIEAYSVLTRLPAPHRVSPSDALTLIEANFMRGVKIVALPAKSYVALLRKAPQDGVSGGRTYDALIAACARRAKAETLLTFNQGDFASLAGLGLEIVIPGAR